jgi:hypothetical protein
VLTDGLLVIDVATGATQDIRTPWPTGSLYGASDLHVWAPDGWIYYRGATEGSPTSASITRLYRIRPGDAYPELVLEDIGEDYLETPVFVDADTALVAHNGGYWRLDIGDPGHTQYIYPFGTLGPIAPELEVHSIHLSTRSPGLATTG